MVPIVHVRRDRTDHADESRELVGEAPLTIQLVGGASYTIMRTPGDDAELVLGFLFAEGVIDEAEDVEHLDHCRSGDRVTVFFIRGQRKGAERNLVVHSSCGLCGREAIDELLAGLPAVAPEPRFSREVLFTIPGDVRAKQALFQHTGGSHAAGLFDASGSLLVVKEDLGRHSALDKALGYALQQQIVLEQCGVFLSGRSSMEMLVKAARARIGLVLSVSAPSQAAVELAIRQGITLCGFVRGKEATIYSHPERIV